MRSARIETRTAVPSDVPALRRIWQACFGDAEDYIDFFLRARFVPENTCVLTADGGVVSQLFLLPAALQSGETRCPVYYLFAAATDPAHQRRGYMGRLLEMARALARSRGMAGIALLPGEESLSAYYAAHGYETAFYRRVWRCTREELSAAAARPGEQTDAVEVLRQFLQSRDGLIWDDPALRYALAEHRAFRGNYAAVTGAFASADGDEGQILTQPSRFAEGCGLLLTLSDAAAFTVTLPPDAPHGALRDGGMLLRLDSQIVLHDGFLSFAME